MRQSRRQPTTSREPTDDVITGTGHDTGLSAIPRSSRREKKYIGLFVSRLSPNTRAGNIVSHVYNKTGMIVKCAPHPTVMIHILLVLCACDTKTEKHSNESRIMACWIDFETILEIYLIVLFTAYNNSNIFRVVFVIYNLIPTLYTILCDFLF